MKPCTACKEWKDLTAYNPDRRAKDGKQSRCKKCNAAWLREYRVRAGKTKGIRSAGEKTAQSPEAHRESSRKWREKNRDKHRQYNINWRENNKDRHAKYNAEWRQANIERAQVMNQRYIERKKQNGGHFTKEEFDELCAQYNYRCVACGEQKRLTTDHIIPVSKGGSNDIQNIQPLCMSCNSKKRDKIIDYRPHEEAAS